MLFHNFGTRVFGVEPVATRPLEPLNLPIGRKLRSERFATLTLTLSGRKKRKSRLGASKKGYLYSSSFEQPAGAEGLGLLGGTVIGGDL